jgi:hypothetical protein
LLNEVLLREACFTSALIHCTGRVQNAVGLSDVRSPCRRGHVAGATTLRLAQAWYQRGGLIDIEGGRRFWYASCTARDIRPGEMALEHQEGR